MRLFLGDGDGAGMIACPECGLPLLLAAERRGRWVVGYDHLHLRVGRAAMLVCPEIDCPYKEDVQIAGTPDDAVVYNSRRAASLWRTGLRSLETLGELRDQLEHIADAYERAGNPKAPSAYRYWRDRYHRACGRVVPPLKHALKSDTEVILEGKETRERGRVMELFPDSVLLDRTENNETVLVPLGSLARVRQNYFAFRTAPKPRFDFHEDTGEYERNHCVHTPKRFAMVSGHRVILSQVSRFGNCVIQTPDPEVAQALGIRLRVAGDYWATIPAGLVDRCFLSVRWCHVQGHRLEMYSATAVPGVFRLRTRSLETARALKMHREVSRFIPIGRREPQGLRWWGYFDETEIEQTEEKQIPLNVSEMIRYAQIEHRKDEARRIREELEWAALEAEDAEDAEDDEEEEGEEGEGEENEEQGQDDQDENEAEE